MKQGKGIRMKLKSYEFEKIAIEKGWAYEDIRITKSNCMTTTENLGTVFTSKKAKEFFDNLVLEEKEKEQEEQAMEFNAWFKEFYNG